MKKQFLLTAFILTTFTLIGCSNANKNGGNLESKALSSTTVESTNTSEKDSNKTSETVPNNNISTPSDFTEASVSQLSSIPDRDGLIGSITNTLLSIGVTNVNTATYGNYSQNDMLITIDAFATTNTKANLLISLQYVSIVSSPEWSVIYIKDADTKNYYYVSDEFKNTVDLYDYATGSLISAKTESLSDAQDKINKNLQDAENEFENSLNELKNKYTK